MSFVVGRCVQLKVEYCIYFIYPLISTILNNVMCPYCSVSECRVSAVGCQGTSLSEVRQFYRMLSSTCQFTAIIIFSIKEPVVNIRLQIFPVLSCCF